jgi:hypothetical protein
MTTDFTRRELAKLAGTGALAMSAAAAVGGTASATEPMPGSATVAQADTSSAPWHSRYFGHCLERGDGARG